MSIPRQTTVSCPHCGTQYQAMIFESLNTDFAPNVAETIISGERFDAKCPSCGFVAHLEYDFLYHDMKHNAMIWVVYTDNEKYEDKIAEIRSTVANSMKLPLSYKLTRIVADMNALREKVACLEAERDDRVVELCKVFCEAKLLEAHPDFCVKHSFYTYVGGKHIVFFYGKTGGEVHCFLDDSIYYKIFEKFKNSLRQMEQTPYQIIDHKWAVGFFNNSQDENSTQSPPQKVTPSSQGDSKGSPEADALVQEQQPPILFCRKCGAKLLPDSLFCSYCGTKLV